MNDLFGPAQTRAIETLEALGALPTQIIFTPSCVRRKGCFDGAISCVELTWDYDYGSNLEEVLRLSESALNGQPGRIVLLSDLFASAHTDDEDEVVFQCRQRKKLSTDSWSIRSCRDASITIDAIRYRSGETRDEDESIVAVVTEAILGQAERWKRCASPIRSPMAIQEDKHRAGRALLRLTSRRRAILAGMSVVAGHG